MKRVKKVFLIIEFVVLVTITISAFAGTCKEFMETSSRIQPVSIKTNVMTVDRVDRSSTSESKYLEHMLLNLGAPSKKCPKLAKSARLASEATGLRPEIFIALMYTESTFNENAVSSKGYKGLMQTPSATFKYAEVDVMHGAMILKDKLEYSNGDLLKALALYKGGNNPLARKYANETYALYVKLVNS